ncbi:MAG: 3-phosphoshikimate 1-carboxyvinyltransferase [candidate division KSB1 bacterium]|nr:3-phosphoshikimate 1-carboxyvinyltransferase [candidate division KSB1 bacterium]MDZ7366348.1 3-phosphoshikimate 1-carboxyvinyltransferase [candidate division KSB1 bacterium]MDZ7404003.1 3-phosphoshikimate 1-carboxyvinyltransferase [candidate division KSB1 bacterium]
MNIPISQAHTFRGRISVPGDKSISHRALMLGAMAEGDTVIRGLAPGEDVSSTKHCLQQLGVIINEKNGEIFVKGRGHFSLQKPKTALDAGNSGTTMRLLAGLLAAQSFSATITGDASLQRRPMRRIIEPLTQMGAKITAQKNGGAPLTIHGGKLHGIHYRLPVASAQVKSCVLFAGLGAEGDTVIEEVIPTRDHSERLLRRMEAGISVSSNQEPVISNHIGIRGGKLRGCEIDIPGDFSSAAFFIAAALLLPKSELLIENAGLNPTRTALLDVTREMGGEVSVMNIRNESYEPVAELMVRHRPLQSAKVSGSRIPLLIDEIPILAVMATQAEGETHIREAQELRVKESDRLAALAKNLRAMGAAIEELPDGLVISGPTKLRGAEIDSFGDHRIAMAFAVAGLLADSPTTIRGAECVNISFPGFFEILKKLAS